MGAQLGPGWRPGPLAFSSSTCPGPLVPSAGSWAVSGPGRPHGSSRAGVRARTWHRPLGGHHRPAPWGTPPSPGSLASRPQSHTRPPRDSIFPQPEPRCGGRKAPRSGGQAWQEAQPQEAKAWEVQPSLCRVGMHACACACTRGCEHTMHPTSVCAQAVWYPALARRCAGTQARRHSTPHSEARSPPQSTRWSQFLLN